MSAVFLSVTSSGPNWWLGRVADVVCRGSTYTISGCRADWLGRLRKKGLNGMAEIELNDTNFEAGGPAIDAARYGGFLGSMVRSVQDDEPYHIGTCE